MTVFERQALHRSGSGEWIMPIHTRSVFLCMGSTDHAADREAKKVLRKEHPSGWLYLTQHDAIPILVDALLDLPPNREFDETELAEHAGVTCKTVSDCTDLLIEVDLIEEIPETSGYRVADSDVVCALHELNAALNNAGDER